MLTFLRIAAFTFWRGMGSCPSFSDSSSPRSWHEILILKLFMTHWWAVGGSSLPGGECWWSGRAWWRHGERRRARRRRKWSSRYGRPSASENRNEKRNDEKRGEYGKRHVTLHNRWRWLSGKERAVVVKREMDMERGRRYQWCARTVWKERERRGKARHYFDRASHALVTSTPNFK